MIQVFKYKKNYFEFDSVDGKIMANATEMCHAFGKRANDWLSLPRTKKYIDAVTRKYGNAYPDLVVTKTGGDDQGTWISDKLVIKLAQWLDVDFEVWCDEKIATLMREGFADLKQASNQWENIVPHLTRPVQIENSVKVNAYNYNLGGVDQTIDYNRENCILHTGKRPSELKKLAKEGGVPSKFRTSGKEVVRYWRPDIAVSMSMTDDLRRTGLSISKAHSLTSPVIPLIAELQRLGRIEE